MSKKDKISIIVPVYNVKEYLEACLDSLIHQTMKEIKIICIDDGSTDGSAKILDRYRRKDNRIKIIKQKNNGLSIARNAGLATVTTPYVMFCDADDCYDSKMCDQMFQAIDANGVDLAVCGIKVFYEAHGELKKSDSKYYKIKFCGKKNIDENLITKTDASVCNKIFRTNLIRKYDIKFLDKLNNEDYYFYNAYMSVAKTCYFINRQLYNYIRHEGSIMSDSFKKSNYSPDHLLVAQKLFSFYKKTGFLEKHTDLFWTQFSESFWFSYNYSGKKYRKKIRQIAKEFIIKNYKKHLPSTEKVRNKVFVILNYNIFYKVLMRIRNILKRIYLKFNIGGQKGEKQ